MCDKYICQMLGFVSPWMSLQNSSFFRGIILLEPVQNAQIIILLQSS